MPGEQTPCSPEQLPDNRQLSIFNCQYNTHHLHTCSSLVGCRLKVIVMLGTRIKGATTKQLSTIHFQLSIVCVAEKKPTYSVTQALEYTLTDICQIKK